MLVKCNMKCFNGYHFMYYKMLRISKDLYFLVICLNLSRPRLHDNKEKILLWKFKGVF